MSFRKFQSRFSNQHQSIELLMYLVLIRSPSWNNTIHLKKENILGVMRANLRLKIFFLVIVTFLFLIATSLPQEPSINRQFNRPQSFIPFSNDRNNFRPLPPAPFVSASSSDRFNYRGVSCGYEVIFLIHMKKRNMVRIQLDK